MSYASDALIDAQEREIKKLESENASLRGAVQGLGELCDRYKAKNTFLRACLGDDCADCAVGMGEYADSLCDPLKSENEKLKKRLAQYELFREVVGDPASKFASLRRELHRVERENAKLRDLVYSILKCAGEIGRDSGCDKCPMNTDGDLDSYLDGTWCKLRSTLREVGIEVE